MAGDQHSVHAVGAPKEGEFGARNGHHGRDARVTRHDAAVSSQNVLRATHGATTSATTRRDYLSAHRKAADRGKLLSTRLDLLRCHPSPDGMEWLMELRGISRAIGTSWIIPLTR